MDSSVKRRNHIEITQLEKHSTASARRGKIYEGKDRGYCSIKLGEDLMDTLNQNFGVRNVV